MVTDHTGYEQLASCAKERREIYRGLFALYVDAEALATMQEAITANYPVGNNRFREKIMRELGRSIGHVKRGRPTKQQENIS